MQRTQEAPSRLPSPRRRLARRATLAVLLLTLPLAGLWGLRVLKESREAARTTAAITTLKAIMAAQTAFRESRTTTLRYGTIEELCEAGLLDPQLVDESRGYRYSISLSPEPQFTWGVIASPVEVGERWFVASQMGTISLSREPIAFNEDGTLPQDLVGL